MRYSGGRKYGGSLLLFAAAAALGHAQVMQAPGTFPHGAPAQVPPQSDAPKTAPSLPPAPHTHPATRPSLLDQPAQPAKVLVADERLTVQADNSSLDSILHTIAEATGMAVDGLAQDQRVFGQYGPGRPQDVLSSLLADSGYNVMMVGAVKDGAPRQLLLTARNSSAPPPASAHPNVEPADQDDDEPPVFTPSATDANAPIPGAAVSATPPPSPNNDGAVKSPQQLLQEMQQMHQQQLEQQQQQQAPQ